MWLSQVGATPGEEQQQLCVHWSPCAAPPPASCRALLRLQDVQELWEFGMDLESDGAETAPAGSKVSNPSALPWQSCALGRVGCRV